MSAKPCTDENCEKNHSHLMLFAGSAEKQFENVTYKDFPTFVEKKLGFVMFLKHLSNDKAREMNDILEKDPNVGTLMLTSTYSEIKKIYENLECDPILLYHCYCKAEHFEIVPSKPENCIFIYEMDITGLSKNKIMQLITIAKKLLKFLREYVWHISDNYIIEKIDNTVYFKFPKQEMKEKFEVAMNKVNERLKKYD